MKCPAKMHYRSHASLLVSASPCRSLPYSKKTSRLNRFPLPNDISILNYPDRSHTHPREELPCGDQPCRHAFFPPRRAPMSTGEYLFPHRLTRRDFLRAAGAAGVAATGLNASAASADDAKKAPVTVGAGKWTYTLDEDWGKLPAGMKYGFGCALVV